MNIYKAHNKRKTLVHHCMASRGKIRNFRLIFCYIFKKTIKIQKFRWISMRICSHRLIRSWAYLVPFTR